MTTPAGETILCNGVRRLVRPDPAARPSDEAIRALCDSPPRVERLTFAGRPVWQIARRDESAYYLPDQRIAPLLSARLKSPSWGEMP